MEMIIARFTRQEVLRASTVLAGGIILIFALMADQLGYGQPGRFGSGQFLLALISVALIAIGWQGRKILNLYHSVALILMNTLIFLAILELGAIAVARSGILPSYRQKILQDYKEIPYYSAQVWADQYFQEAVSVENYQYRPYVVWSHQPYRGEMVNVDDNGHRVTPGAECTTSAYQVFAFGGSTMWGWGAPDWGTIPAYLQDGLHTEMRDPTCVINFGEDGFVSTQSLVSLILQLRSGNIPDMVIFYDGINDVYASYESGEAGNPVTLSAIAEKFEDKEHPLIQWIKTSRSYALVEDVAIRSQFGEQLNSRPIETDKLADLVIEVYLSNYKMVALLAQQYDFDYYFFWQPHIAVGDKPLTAAEQEIASRLDPTLGDLANAVYNDISLGSQEQLYLMNLTNLFDEEDDQIWIDEWGHVTPEGNRLVAQAMLDMIQPNIARK